MNNSIVYGVIMLLTGLGIPTMAALNGALGARLQNPEAAAVLLFAVGLVTSIITFFITSGWPIKVNLHASIPWYFYCGGLAIVFYVFSVTWIGPRFGIGNAISFVLLGQLIAMTAIDHFALFGATEHAITLRRLLGLILMAAGVFLVVNRVPSH